MSSFHHSVSAHTTTSSQSNWRKSSTRDRIDSSIENSSFPVGAASQTMSTIWSDDAGEFHAILGRLEDAIVVQKNHIYQASHLLSLCRQNEKFRGKREEV